MNDEQVDCSDSVSGQQEEKQQNQSTYILSAVIAVLILMIIVIVVGFLICKLKKRKECQLKGMLTVAYQIN